jgi:hypothetical protein
LTPGAEKDLADSGRIGGWLSTAFTELCMRVEEDIRRCGYVGRTVGIK